MELTITDRALAALKEHGQLSLDDLAKHVGTSKTTMYTYTGTLVKKHGVRRVEGKRGVYELAGATVKISVPEKYKVRSDSPYAAALADLRTKREAMALDLTKLDSAIAAIEALG